MIGALILWSHALAALMLGVVALAQRARAGGAVPRAMLLIALIASALWALAVAGIDARDVSTGIAESIRTIAWLGFMFVLVRRAGAASAALSAVYGVVIVLAVVSAMLAVWAGAVADPPLVAALAATRGLFQWLTVLAALMLVHHMQTAVVPPAQGGLRLLVAALALIWGADLVQLALAYPGGIAQAVGEVARGAAMAAAAVLVGIGAQRSSDWRLALSRRAAVRTLAAIALALYVGLAMLATSVVAMLGGEHARLVQTAIVFGAAAALLTLLSTPWLRAWTRVKIAKHLFSHRYDYRSEWQRFTETLGQPGEDAAPLAVRVVKAVADLTHSPGGLLLLGDTLERAADWAWPDDDAADGGAPLARFLAGNGRIVELDAVRSGRGVAAERAAVPGWLLTQTAAWAVVPISHAGVPLGAIVLARPPVDRSLDWEDFDLLRVVGQQAASYLAEDRAHAALADARRFDEFNRRFAFILHDVKNLVSQLTLTARNAERHADNPAFRADMVATLRDSSERMQALLARLSQHNGARAESPQPVDVPALLHRVAATWRAAHPVECRGDATALALAQPGRLETVLAHLVQNAVDASAPGAAIVLEAGAAAGQVTIAVIDRGEGMTPAFVRDQLFRPFVSTKPGGFGIGAFEARQLVEAMGGTIAVDSRVGAGTRFSVTLPAATMVEMAA